MVTLKRLGLQHHGALGLVQGGADLLALDVAILHQRAPADLHLTSDYPLINLYLQTSTVSLKATVSYSMKQLLRKFSSHSWTCWLGQRSVKTSSIWHHHTWDNSWHRLCDTACHNCGHIWPRPRTRLSPPSQSCRCISALHLVTGSQPGMKTRMTRTPLFASCLGHLSAGWDI